jgi:hypothetical protein
MLTCRLPLVGIADGTVFTAAWVATETPQEEFARLSVHLLVDRRDLDEPMDLGSKTPDTLGLTISSTKEATSRDTSQRDAILAFFSSLALPPEIGERIYF